MEGGLAVQAHCRGFGSRCVRAITVGTLRSEVAVMDVRSLRGSESIVVDNKVVEVEHNLLKSDAFWECQKTRQPELVFERFRLVRSAASDKIYLK